MYCKIIRHNTWHLGVRAVSRDGSSAGHHQHLKIRQVFQYLKQRRTVAYERWVYGRQSSRHQDYIYRFLTTRCGKSNLVCKQLWQGDKISSWNQEKDKNLIILFVVSRGLFTESWVLSPSLLIEWSKEREKKSKGKETNRYWALTVSRCFHELSLLIFRAVLQGG